MDHQTALKGLEKEVMQQKKNVRDLEDQKKEWEKSKINLCGSIEGFKTQRKEDVGRIKELVEDKEEVRQVFIRLMRDLKNEKKELCGIIECLQTERREDAGRIDELVQVKEDLQKALMEKDMDHQTTLKALKEEGKQQKENLIGRIKKLVQVKEDLQKALKEKDTDHKTALEQGRQQKGKALTERGDKS
jgi:chromosome segregation ATPase